ncbi:hypothetical protein CYFUS_002590 [Cystobacter fuscus]|uniref:Lipoprotein n=1 Tax=Cystobacter fuscus TaxID=43 RepID=A0A250IZL1_9BACT|nr:hypothetical protein [Cystobacter fuscus]ATB37169.1 hypothetical protein CYFUS_002590 [Cystobacter fuscus]
MTSFRRPSTYHLVLALLAGTAGIACGSEPIPDSGPLSTLPDVCPSGLVADNRYPLIQDSPYAADYRLRVFGQVDFQGQTYKVVNALPWDYLASHVQAGKTFPVTETPSYYVVDSNFELPYLPCLMDEVAWTPGNKNKGWAIGSNDDPAALVAKNGAGRPFLYHVVTDNEYGYFTYTEPLPGDPIRYSGFRPTWVVHEEGALHPMYYLDPARPDRHGFSWPRHGDKWELNFGLFVDSAGKVYVPKKAPLAVPQWDTYLECVVINMANAPIPTTRTQFPGNESYYAADTFIPGYAAPPAVGHRYWGQKGREMSEVAVWEDDGGPGLPSPGNYHKPYSGGCDTKGYNFAHAEGFTWPELRAYRTAHGDAVTRDQLYSITVYKVARDGTARLLGTLSYEQQANGEWIPTGSGPEAHSLNDRNGRWIINGPIFPDRGERAVAVLRNL